MTRKDAAKDSAKAGHPTPSIGSTENARGEDRGASCDASREAPQTGRRAPLVRDLLSELTRRERLVLMLRYTEELTIAEIAAVLEIAASEVERLLVAVVERVRARIQPVYGRPGTA